VKTPLPPDRARAFEAAGKQAWICGRVLPQMRGWFQQQIGRI